MYISGSRLKSFSGWELFCKIMLQERNKKGRFLMSWIPVAYSAFQIVIDQIEFLIKQKRKGMPLCGMYEQATGNKTTCMCFMLKIGKLRRPFFQCPISCVKCLGRVHAGNEHCYFLRPDEIRHSCMPLNSWGYKPSQSCLWEIWCLSMCVWYDFFQPLNY